MGFSGASSAPSISTALVAATGAVCATAGIAIGWGLASARRHDADELTRLGNPAHANDEVVAELQREVERQKKLRAQERSGRTNAEREAREAIQRQQELNGYNFPSIGHVQSCFAERRGTPRQSALVPSARGRIKFRTSIPPSSLEGLEQFSHLWVIFVFHENTNVAKSKNSTVTAKIAPPRLGGQKVGLFSTRTPHRPNSIGLTVVKIDAVYGRYIEISGHDLVNETPILDVKPYVPMDFVQDHQCPHWVNDKSDHLAQPIEFAPDALQALTILVEQKKLRFYSSLEDVCAAIEQVLALDIRGVHQGRGKTPTTGGGELEVQLFQCRFDNVLIEFQTLIDRVHVVQCSFVPSK